MVLSAADLGPDGRPYSVREIVRRIRQVVAAGLPRAVAVCGEIADFRRHESSGHLYFALRDGEAVLRCVMFQSEARSLRCTPASGLMVEVQGLVDLYEKQGQLQLRVHALVPAGRGSLMAALEARREKLAREGLFALERKRPLPSYVRVVGLVTSPSGAALRDFVRLIRQRAPQVEILLAPATVQGEGAALSVARAIELQNRYGAADVLLVGRGGGSLEDLWAFNEEPLVRAVAGSRIPVVSAVGHESDVTLADLAADVRAATPSHAVELVVLETRRLLAAVAAAERRLGIEMNERLAAARRRLVAAGASPIFRRPARAIGQASQRLDELEEALGRAAGAHRRRFGARLGRSLVGLLGAGRALTPARAARLEGLAGRLAALGPGQVLSRGYALVRRPDGRAVAAASGLERGERVWLDFHDGRVAADVRAVELGRSLLTPAPREEGR